MDVIVVCHTEFGTVKNREVVYDKRAIEGVTVGVPNLMNVADKYGVKVTFAVMPEVVDHFPKSNGQEPISARHEVGIHIHPGWQAFNINNHHYDVGDAFLREYCKMSSTSTVLRDYPYSEQLDMIKAGKEHIAEVLGAEPRAFVGGRWSINNDTVKALISAGLTHDCSAPAHKKRSHHDWSRLPRICMPYHPSAADYQKKGDMPLLIVPISQTILGASVSPEIIPVIGRRWLESCFLEYYRLHMPLFHICLHSPCMTDPYFIGQMDALLRFIAKHEVSFKCASQVKEYEAVRNMSDPLSYISGFNGDMARTCMDKLFGRLKRSDAATVR